MADFPVTPDLPVKVINRHKTLISEFSGGAEQRRSQWANPLREFQLTFANRTKAEYDLFDAFLLLKKGPLTAFTFENPNDGVTYNVRFKTDDVEAAMVAYEIFSWQCNLLEVK